MNFPSWMKPHLKQRLQQEQADKERTGPVNGEKALACENGKVREVVTDHKPAPAKDLPKPPKNGCVLTDGGYLMELRNPAYSWEAIHASERRIEVQEEMARQMKAHQQEVMALLGLPDPLNLGMNPGSDYPVKPLTTEDVKASIRELRSLLTTAWGKNWREARENRE